MKKLNQSGAVAMISVVIFSIIITILVAAYARTIISQQREALNYDMSTRAYYAAESGVQDVIRELADANSSVVKNGGQNTCTNNSVYLGGNTTGKLGDSDSLAITCELVDVDAKAIEGSTEEGASRLWKIETKGDNATRIQVRWSSKAGDQAGYTPPAGSDNNKLFLPVSAWNGNAYPPVVRISLIRKVATDYQQVVYFVKPSNNDSSDMPVVSFSQTQAPDSKVQVGYCPTQAAGYACSITFDSSSIASDMQSGKIYAVIQGVYGEADYQIAPSDTAGNSVGVENFIDIDVTARAGSVFRRVKQQVNMGGNDTYQPSWFDASALVVGDGICKLFTVGSLPSPYLPCQKD